MLNTPRLPLILVVENVRSLHNIGAIFRSADAAGVEQIILTGLTATPPRHEIEKTALGATQSVPWTHVVDPLPTLRSLKERGYTVAALEQTPTACDLYTCPVSFPLALIVGHERMGVSAETLAVCDYHLELPMHGHSAHSLNVSTATTVALYELGRRLWYHT